MSAVHFRGAIRSFLSRSLSFLLFGFFAFAHASSAQTVDESIDIGFLVTGFSPRSCLLVDSILRHTSSRINVWVIAENAQITKAFVDLFQSSCNISNAFVTQYAFQQSSLLPQAAALLDSVVKQCQPRPRKAPRVRSWCVLPAYLTAHIHTCTDHSFLLRIHKHL